MGRGLKTLCTFNDLDLQILLFVLVWLQHRIFWCSYFLHLKWFLDKGLSRKHPLTQKILLVLFEN